MFFSLPPSGGGKGQARPWAAEAQQLLPPIPRLLLPSGHSLPFTCLQYVAILPILAPVLRIATIIATCRGWPTDELVIPMENESFSSRHGYAPRDVEIRIREDAPDSLRVRILQAAKESDVRPSELREIICDLAGVFPDESNWSEYPNIDGEVRGHAKRLEWYKVYDFIERIYQHLMQQHAFNSRDFAGRINEFFLSEGIGWKLESGSVQARGSDDFEAAVGVAEQELERAGRSTAAGEIREALQDLSRRPSPDLTGAVQHGMAALECVARDTSGDCKATLGQVLQRYAGLIPKPLDKAIEKAWGYASEQGRHIREGRTPDRAEAELIVGIAATVATYLTRRDQARS